MAQSKEYRDAWYAANPGKRKQYYLTYRKKHRKLHELEKRKENGDV